MQKISRLNAANLKLLHRDVAIPAYDRAGIKSGIVHIGVGGFHRAHEAYCTDLVLQGQKVTDWGICAIALLETDRRIIDTLVNQDGLYTLMVTRPDGSLSARVIGSIIEYIFAPEHPGAALEKMADPQVKIITLTITEGGYNFDSATGEFLIGEPAIQWDLKHPDKPKTVYGYITQALKRRSGRGTAGLTIQSCDNIQKNGEVLRKMLLTYVKEAEPGLAGWIEQHVTFPNSMVDRITPVTSSSDIEKLRAVYAIDDAWPVVCEPFFQWVIEDNFASGRPDWENAGAHFVTDVGPYEKMKIRLLNAGHSLLGLLGSLYGCGTVDEAVNVPILRSFLRDFMDNEVTPVLGKIEGINLDDYKNSLFQRFGNPSIRDHLSRICLESSAKIPKFLLPTLIEQLERGGPIVRSTLIIAAWCRYLELYGTPGYSYEIYDKMKDVLYDRALASLSGDPLAFLKIEAVFNDLVHNERFVNAYLCIIDYLRRYGVEKTVMNIDLLIK